METLKKFELMQKIVRELDLEKEVEFVGWIKNKREFFDSIDIFCLPSKNEPFGIVLLEAMKYRKPIISTKADGPLEILRDEVDALMIDIEPLASMPNASACASTAPTHLASAATWSRWPVCCTSAKNGSRAVARALRARSSAANARIHRCPSSLSRAVSARNVALNACCPRPQKAFCII